MVCSRSMRSAIGGWVLNRRLMAPGFIGSEIHRCDMVEFWRCMGRPYCPSFASALDRNSTTTDQILKNTQSLTAKLDGAADKLDGVLTSAQGFLGQPGGKGTFDQVGEAAVAIRKLADNLDKRTKEIAENINKFSGSGLRDYQALAQNGQRTLDELNRTVRSLQKNPQQDGAKTPNLLIISMTSDKQIYVEKDQFDLPGLKDKISKEIAANPTEKILLKADQTLTVGDVRKVMLAAQHGHAKGVGLGVQEEKK